MEQKKDSLLLGAHMSIAGGLEQALIKGESIGCTAIGMFTKSNRQWGAKALTSSEIELFKATKRNSAVQQVVAHASYLINLAASDQALYEKSIAALIDEINRCNQLDIPYLVLHPGSAGIQQNHAALARIATGINTVFNKTSGNVMLLLETMAGQGSSTCSRFEELAAILAAIDQKKRIGVCFDTCHIFAAGYDISSLVAYENTWREFDQTIGIDQLRAFHINDSLKELASRVDRHANIGEGKIGITAFTLIMNDERFFSIPKIIETPKGETELDDDIRNIALLKSLLSEDARKKIIV